ncbi:class I SAM-dependent methyltransferase [Bradyrhizobium guangdongense]|uniref:SAM-dependent methyltransferase n=1 Tax=Bradyrhizobium guangdongense TaxID=1325090 RepID=A0A410VDL9_9BRAD|nr:class I SAM-dependent methyltransferase [Bradyrhizobium guangdongense]QAU41813.1 SAM-dependent methyltransferase [Bradyrhizobium guangdongense]QOZ62873.1 SAM-dependent methyltransferase [Bradyrhizobium guangdongense]GGI24672.1 SAM-dependent methyltransferase [Bradyrhizobium guangdongense]
MNKSATIDFATASNIPVQTQALLQLVPGEARDSLLAIHEVLRQELPQGRLAIYEAGGGSSSFLPMDVLGRSHVTVVDIDEDQVRNNTYADDAILGDVQTYRFAPESFDVVICYNVIEHLPDVGAALLNFRDALKRGGMILIGAPNPRSLSGVVTKYSPHWFHVWFYRNIRGIKTAGLPGEAPFPTFFHPLVTLPKLEAFAAVHGLETIYRREVESPRYPEMRKRKPLFATLVDAGAMLLNAVLPGGTDVRRGDYHIILRKR